MIAEAIESIVGLNNRATAIQIVREFHDRVWYCSPDGTIAELSKPNPPRDYGARSQADFVAQLMHLHGRVAPDGSDKSGVVMFGEGKMVAVLDETGHRKQTIEYGMPLTAAFKALVALAGKYVTQAEMARAMRTELAEIAPQGLVTFLANVRLTRNVESEGAIATGMESIRRDVKSSMSGAGEIPEVVEFRTCIYVDHCNDPSFTQTFSFVLDCNFETGKLALMERGDCFVIARRQTDERVRDELNRALSSIGVRAFLGTFSA